MPRKHVKTRQSFVHFDATSIKSRNLVPGTYRIHHESEDNAGRCGYVGSFIIHPDQTVEFYGANLNIIHDLS